MYLCKMEITRKTLINTSIVVETKRLTATLPNDMELGKAIRNLINKTNEQLEKLHDEEVKN